MIYSDKGELNPLCMSEECTGKACDNKCREPSKLCVMREVVDVEASIKVSSRICGHNDYCGAAFIFGRL